MRKVFSCFDNDGFNPLVYERTFGMQGTLSFWFKREGTLSRDRYLLSIVNNNTLKLGLYINGNTIYFFNNGITNTYDNPFNDSLWHNIKFAWSSGYMSISFDGVAKGAFTFSFLGNSLLYFGSSQGNKTYASNGYFESIYISDVNQANAASYIESARPKTIGYLQDSLGRVTSKKIVVGNGNFVTNYLYDKTRIITETFHNDDSINYSYDSMGNVEEIAYADRSVNYEYDKLGRLTRHNNGLYTECFSYDQNGDITEITLNNGTDNDFIYSYDNKHRLTSVKNNSINYRVLEYSSNSFYPSTIKFYNNGYQGKNIGFTWQGKRIVGASFSGVPVIEYRYDENGIMTYRSTPGEEFYFTLEGSNVISLRKESNGGSNNSIVLDFTYDSNNMLAGITYNNKEYFYARDILGNIYGIINSSGNYIIKYDYNAYGEVTKNILALSGDDLVVANHNPFMYKGYYYDSDLECYYLKSRFYMPSICRFISPDDHSYLDYEDLRGINLYCYCYDNPVMYSDPDGNMPKWVSCVLIGTIAAAAIALTIVSCGSASAAIAPIAFAYFGIAANTTLAITTAVAVTTCIGIAAFAIADIQDVLTDGNNYLSFLGEYYDDVKGAFYFTAYMFAYVGQFAQDGWGRQTSGTKKAPQKSYKYGAYTKISPKGNDTTIYNGRGQAIYRYDFSRPHNGMSPHIHRFKWWVHDGKWRWDGPEGTVYPY